MSLGKWTLNDRDEDGNITKAAPTFDYIENKAIEEEHRKGQLGNHSADTNAIPAFTISQSLGDKKVIPSSDGKTCRIEINNVPCPFLCFLSQTLSQRVGVLQEESLPEGPRKREKDAQIKAQRCIHGPS
ncbi:uncharacterized protein N7446_010801 [Penicillium canescens]|uniref:uncharacterized protein n=1 Tax=Penicillium canescens TaxID=5083 RepID=UPI0026E0DBFF|nr:uncharacterized protein N7446_010801 [Penicillium canescens]KAJ6050692.1 hypothetical protein N7446_010801 [Penicillium canescens]